MKEAKTIGLTGQTGAGKSTIAAYAARQGCAVIEADLVAREALEKGSDCLKRLAKVFGYDIAKKYEYYRCEDCHTLIRRLKTTSTRKRCVSCQKRVNQTKKNEYKKRTKNIQEKNAVI